MALCRQECRHRHSEMLNPIEILRAPFFVALSGVVAQLLAFNAVDITSESAHILHLKDMRAHSYRFFTAPFDQFRRVVLCQRHKLSIKENSIPCARQTGES